ncbi:hypothetical protein LMC07_04380 [Limosilactobacillus reuteri]|nr:hypothetical protein [Limosilactobacillus reuteri]
MRNVQGDVSTLKQTATGIKSTLASHEGDIHTLQADSKSLKDSMTNAQGDISTLQKSATSLDSEMKDHAGRLSKVEQNAATQTTTLSDLQGNLTQVKQQADGLVTTLKDAQGSITQIQQKADGMLEQLKSAQGDIASLQTDVTGIKATITDHDKNIHTLQADAKSLTDDMTDAQGNISKLQKTSTDLTSEMQDHSGRLSKVEQTATEHSTTISNLLSEVEWKQVSNTTLDTMKSAGHFWGTGKDLTGKPGNIKDTDQVRVVVEAPSDNSVSQMLYVNGLVWQRSFNGKMWSKWVRSANQGDVDSLQGNISQVKQTADGLVTTLKDAQGNIDQLQQTAKGTAEQISSLNGDITSLQKDVNGIKLTIVDHDKNIHTLQADSKSLHDDMEDAQGNISSLQKTATSLDSEFKDHDGRISKVEQTANTLTNEFSDQQGHLNRVEQTAQGTQQTVANQQGQINTIKTDADGIHETLTGQGNQIANINVTLSGLNSKYEGVSGDLGKLKGQVTTNSTQITQNKQAIALKADQTTVNNLSGEVSQNKAQFTVQAGQISSKVSGMETSLSDTASKLNNLVTSGRNYIQNSKSITMCPNGTDNYDLVWYVYDDAFASNAYCHGNNKTRFSFYLTPSKALPTARTFRIYWRAAPWNSFGTITVPANTTDTQYYELTMTTPTSQPIASQIFIRFMAQDTSDISYTITKSMLTIGDSFPDWSPAPEDTDAKITANSTAIDQTDKKISLKADQTEVDKVKGTASQNSSRLDVMNNEINSKVSSTDVNNILDSKGYATTSTVQSLIDQKSNTINESIVKLSGKVNNNNGGGINLLKATDFANADMATLRKYWGSSFTIRDGVALQVDGLALKSGRSDATQVVQVDPDTDYTLSFEVHNNAVADGGNWNKIQTFLVEFKDSETRKTTDKYTDNGRSVVNTNKRNDNIQTIHTQPDCHYIRVIFRANPKVLFSFVKPKLERGNTATPYSPAPSDNATVTQLQSVTASIDGLQSRVTNYQNDTSSKYTQLSNLMQSKVNQGDLSSVRTQLANAINDRVGKGELMSQINLQAGNTLIQSNKLYLDASSVVITGTAFIPSAAIAELDADKLTFYGNGSKASIGAGIAQYDQDKIKSTINLQYQGGFEIHSSNQLGSILTMHDNTVRLAVKSNGMANPNSPTDQYSGFYASTSYSLMNSYLKDGTTSGISIGSTDSGVNKDYRIHVYDGSNASNNLSKGISISTSSRFDVYAGNSQLFLGPDKAELRGNDHATVHGNDHTFIEGGNQQIYMHNGEVNIGNPNDTGNATGVHLRVFGWASYNGYVEAMGWNTKSTLSSKTRIQPLDTVKALATVNATDLTTFQYKTEVAEGMTKRHAGPVIDDIHDVAQYSTPDAFIAENRQGRSDADIIGYLMGAVQELSKQLNEIKEKI